MAAELFGLAELRAAFSTGVGLTKRTIDNGIMSPAFGDSIKRTFLVGPSEAGEAVPLPLKIIVRSYKAFELHNRYLSQMLEMCPMIESILRVVEYAAFSNFIAQFRTQAPVMDDGWFASATEGWPYYTRERNPFDAMIARVILEQYRISADRVRADNDLRSNYQQFTNNIVQFYPPEPAIDIIAPEGIEGVRDIDRILARYLTECDLEYRRRRDVFVALLETINVRTYKQSIVDSKIVHGLPDLMPETLFVPLVDQLTSKVYDFLTKVCGGQVAVGALVDDYREIVQKMYDATHKNMMSYFLHDPTFYDKVHQDRLKTARRQLYQGAIQSLNVDLLYPIVLPLQYLLLHVDRLRLITVNQGEDFILAAKDGVDYLRMARPMVQKRMQSAFVVMLERVVHPVAFSPPKLL